MHYIVALLTSLDPNLSKENAHSMIITLKVRAAEKKICVEKNAVDFFSFFGVFRLLQLDKPQAVLKCSFCGLQKYLNIKNISKNCRKKRFQQ